MVTDKRMEVAGMKTSVKVLARCTQLNKKINTEIQKKHKVGNAVEEIITHWKRWKDYIDRTGENTGLKITWNCKSTKQRVKQK
jgi:hypothetical protein